MLKPRQDWYGKPTEEPNPHITLEVANALKTQKALNDLGVLISDPVQDYDGNLVGALLDSEATSFGFAPDQKNDHAGSSTSKGRLEPSYDFKQDSAKGRRVFGNGFTSTI